MADLSAGVIAEACTPLLRGSTALRSSRFAEACAPLLRGSTALRSSRFAGKARTRGGFVTILTVLALVVALGATWFGLSANDHVAANFDATSWMWSVQKGELARVNGITGKVDTRKDVQSARGRLIQVSQSDRFVILRDPVTGQVSAFDPATLNISANLESQQGTGITIALRDDKAFLIDPVQGIVRQLDPATLQPIGQSLNFPPGITGGAFDGLGRLWIAVPSEGTVAAISPVPTTAQGGGAGGSSPTRVVSENVAEPAHDLILSALDNGVAVLDQTNGSLVTLRGDKLTKVQVGNKVAGGLLPSTAGGAVPITVSEGRHVYLISGDGTNATVKDFTVPGTGARLQPAVVWAGRIYVADEANGEVYMLDIDGKLLSTINVPKHGGVLELEIRENHLFINAPYSETARVINDKHEVKIVEKHVQLILGAEPPPPPPPPAPVIGKPGAPRKVTAVGGDNIVRLSWSKAPENGSRITKYVVTGDGRTWDAGTNQRTLMIDKLVNGKTYVFEVKAVNAQGTGPGRKSNAVVPMRDVPDATTKVTAVAKPNGTTEVTWEPANGQGRKITRYEVTAISAGATSLVGTTPGTPKLIIPASELTFGTQYAFTVIAVNDLNAGSAVSPASNTVVPYSKPGAITSLVAAPDRALKGTIKVSWQPGQDNGRPIKEYAVTATGKPAQTVTATSITLNGYTDGQIVTVKVAAVNDAGAGPERTTSAKTLTPATVSNVRNSAPTYNAFTIQFDYNDGGGNATCAIVINTARYTPSCAVGASGWRPPGLGPGNTYRYTVSVTNAVNTATSTQVTARTPVLYGWVRCLGCADGVGAYSPYSTSPIRVAQDNGCCALGNRQNSSTRTYTALCKAPGGVTSNSENRNATLNSAGENSGKTSAWWIRVTGNEYIPYAYLNLEGYTNTSTSNISYLPDC